MLGDLFRRSQQRNQEAAPGGRVHPAVGDEVKRLTTLRTGLHTLLSPPDESGRWNPVPESAGTPHAKRGQRHIVSTPVHTLIGLPSDQGTPFHPHKRSASTSGGFIEAPH